MHEGNAQNEEPDTEIVSYLIDLRKLDLGMKNLENKEYRILFVPQ